MWTPTFFPQTNSFHQFAYHHAITDLVRIQTHVIQRMRINRLPLSKLGRCSPWQFQHWAVLCQCVQILQAEKVRWFCLRWKIFNWVVECHVSAPFGVGGFICWHTYLSNVKRLRNSCDISYKCPKNRISARLWVIGLTGIRFPKFEFHHIFSEVISLASPPSI